ncbi:MAG: DUF2283 domain-containing protein [Euryarchaeota archaeon]|nr:DUF2283 domain-containing protein [Euryarchaeota archaeon]
MKSYYDGEVDVLLIKIKDNKPAYGEDIGGGIIVHFDESKAPVEIEILDAKRHLVDWIGQALAVKKETPAVV